MKRLLLIPLLASIVASPAAAPAQSRPAAAQRPKPAAGAAQGLRARPVEIAVHAPRPKDLPDDLAFYGPEDGRYEICYLVRGTGFSRVDKDSFRVSSATAGGTDISKNAKGAPSWSLDPFPKVSDDGTAATFTLRVDPGRDRMKAAMPVVHGSIDVERASGKETKTATLSLAPGSSVSLGPVTVRVPEPKKKGAPAAFDGDAASDVDAAGDPSAALAAAIASAAKESGSAAPGEAEAAQALAAFFGGAFGGGGAGDEIDLRLEGELGALASLVLVADGEELEPGMKMTFDARSATWSFPAAGGSSVKVKAEIWKDIRRETVSF